MYIVIPMAKTVYPVTNLYYQLVNKLLLELCYLNYLDKMIFISKLSKTRFISVVSLKMTIYIINKL